LARRREPNDLFRAVRAARRVHGTPASRSELAEQTNAWLADRTPPPRLPPRIDGNYIGKIERGDIRWPGPLYREAFRAVLGVPADPDLGFERRHTRDADGALPLPADHGLTPLWTGAGLDTAYQEITIVERRVFLALSGTTLAAIAAGWATADPVHLTGGAEGSGLGAGLLADLELRVAALHRMAFTLGDERIYRMVIEELSTVTRLLRDGYGSAAERAALHRFAAELAFRAGFAYRAADNHAGAQRFWLVSLRAAHEADQPGFGAHVLRYLAGLETSRGNPAEAVALLRYGRSMGRHTMTPVEQAEHAAALAVSHASVGDYDRMYVEIDAARAYAEERSGSSGPERAYMSGGGSHILSHHFGRALLAADKPEAAVTELELSLSSLAPDAAAFWWPHQAKDLVVAYARADQPERAVKLGHETITITVAVGDARMRSDVRGMCRAIGLTGVPGGTELADHAREAL
jgi:hypothetical protein